MKKCLVPGCDRPFCAKGMCKRHYYQMRETGRTHAIGTANGAPLAFLRQHVSYRSEACLIWPYAQDASGYGAAEMGELRTTAHRIMCILAHGEPPTAEHEAAHSCGNRLCVNPQHLRFKTPLENNRERYAHGTMPLGSKNASSIFTDAQVLLIAADIRSNPEIAKEYRCSVPTVLAIKTGKTWSWLTGIKRAA